jgi:DGQHR domain-containing protein
MSTSTTRRARPTITLIAMEQPNLDTICYRGVAPLYDLAAISQADVFDQVSNPHGLQRDLSPKHASEAYNYVSREQDVDFPRAFPEVILNVRNEDVVHVEKITLGRQRKVIGFEFTFDLTSVLEQADAGDIVVSRVDGNHRLFYAMGNGRREPLYAEVPFQLHVGLSPEQEANLFVDVNANQKGLNSSHLHVLRSRLTPEEQELRDRPERVFARRLASDVGSPWHDLVYLGGSRKGSREADIDRPVSFVTLEQGVRRTLTKSQYIHDLTSPDAQYVLVRNFWQSVKDTFEEEWTDYKEFLVLKNLGVLAFSIMGGTVIDRAMARGEVTPEAMGFYVEQARDRFDWSREATGERSVVGMSGNRAALLIAGELTADLLDPGDESQAVSSLQAKLLEQAPAPEDYEPQEWREQPDVKDLVEAGVHKSVEIPGTE